MLRASAIRKCVDIASRALHMEKCDPTRHIFRSTTNVQTGKQEWMAVDEAYDYHQELARSAYADMLHDSERNEKYNSALKHGIDLLRSRGEQVHLLDIGTGSGLLAMMAVKLGADTVTACEVFRPMYECACQVLQDNGMATKVKVVPKRSTELTVGPGCDLERRANILIAEVFDTELIGEGAISTFNHAHECLITSDAIVIPTRATIYAQVIQSKVIRRWHQLFPMKVSQLQRSLNNQATGQNSTSKSGASTPNLIVDSRQQGALLSSSELVIEVPPEMNSCSGTPSPHDLQLSQIPHAIFDALSEPVAVLHFDFSKPHQPTNANSRKCLEASNSCYTDAVFFWWSLDMDPAGDIVLSCAPQWSRKDDKDIWRDHWLQAIYYPRTAVSFKQGQTIILEAAHDEYSIWFDIKEEDESGPDDPNAPINSNNNNGYSHCQLPRDLSISSDSSACVLPKRNRVDGCLAKENSPDQSQRPLCTCLLHIALGRSRIGAWNDRYRLDRYSLALSKFINPKTSPVCLCLGDGNPLSLICAILGAAKVFTIEPNSMCATVIERFVDYNNLSDRVKIIRKQVADVTENDFDGVKPNLVVAEPEYSYTDGYYLPHLQSLTYWYALKSIRSKQLLSADAVTIPVVARLKMVAMEFEDLWKIRAPVGRCTGFDLTALDDIIQAALEQADPNIEQQPLWEYPGVALSEEHTLMMFDFTNSHHLVMNSPASPLTGSNNVVFTQKVPERDIDREASEDASMPLADSQHEEALSSGILQFVCPGTCNGLAFWIEYTFGGGTITTTPNISPMLIISDGITEPISAGRKPRWSLYHRQGVHLFKNAERVTPARIQLRYSAKLSLDDGQMHFSADFEPVEDEIVT